MCYVLLCTDVTDHNNWTPLHNACIRGHKDVVQYLVEKANCDISEYNTTPMQCYTFISCSGVTDRYGDTPFDLTKRNGHTEIADYLESLPQQCKLTRIMSTQCGPIQLLSLYSCCD